MSGRGSKTRLSQSEARQSFMEEAGRLWDKFSGWYGAHPEATFDDIDQEAGEKGRAHLGKMVELMLRGGDLGAKAEAPRCERCGKEMVFKGYPEKGVHGLKVDVELRRAYYVCPGCGLGFFPLDRPLRLRRDSWSEGAVKAVAWLGTTQPSFEIAAETFSRLVGVSISDTTLWRSHGEVAGQLEQQLGDEERQLSEWAGDEGEEKERVAAQSAVEERVSVSVDGALIRIREEGYREVKMVSVSEVGERSGPSQKQGEAGEDGLKLLHHSYRAMLGDKGTFEPGLRAELVRRRVKDAAEITSVNDGADWIWDLVEKHLPKERVEVLDWSHAVQNLAKAGAAAWGEGDKEAQAWLAERKAELWEGNIAAVGVALLRLPRRRGERGKVIRNVQEYIIRHAIRMDYARFRAEGRPIGSGTVESGVKNVVQWRMKRGGQCWSPTAAKRMLAALGELHSGRWEGACSRLAKAA